MKKAIISVSNKEGIIEFSQELVELGFEIFSTGGTLDLLQKHNVKNVKSIKTLTQFPEILNGRVKTLHPHVHGGILADRSKDDHISTCNEHGIKLIDLVVVNLYPFEETITKADSIFEDAVENIDIGGPTLIRAAAKNHKHVGVVINPEDYKGILKELRDFNGKLTGETKKTLAISAFKKIANYDIAIANYFEAKKSNQEETLPYFICNTFIKEDELRYGENPHQKAGLYVNKSSKDKSLVKLHGKELSYNNYLDIDAAVNIIMDFPLPGAAVIKHTNPCGASMADTLHKAYKNAYESDSLSAFGSIVGLNRTVDEETAKELEKTFIEVIVAPEFEEIALKRLSKKSNLRLITFDSNCFTKKQLHLKDLGTHYLIQTKDMKSLKSGDLKCVTTTEPTVSQVNDLLFSMTLVKYVKSNAILIVKNGKTIGIGAGQMSRIDAVEIALKKAGDLAKGAILASDAFFPFKDSVEMCSEFGIAAIIQPGGSKRDQESIDACNKHNISMVFTGIRHFKH